MDIASPLEQTKSGTSAFMDFTARQFHSPKSVVQSNKCKTSPLMFKYIMQYSLIT
ncbi:Os02g0435400 [Oryza sativa Japonica Group]|uniref:Os02g0435400 protein n=2 Tax=Oryza sativa subsp. japonica TaxID=39947 RepID=B9F5F6_ORYSJ|nr:hypothetical protein OsJ_06536 [Oryza sativa Japonica Group]KAB8087108.1 hypothetical protein EE612_010964 [Oryza sativa]KAB8087109.1 hypothetical protein EE612_010964 [Oryza sativa]BAS78458.1 Os02g0435400 [Oryza sativa Japonica Group]